MPENIELLINYRLNINYIKYINQKKITKKILRQIIDNTYKWHFVELVSLIDVSLFTKSISMIIIRKCNKFNVDILCIAKYFPPKALSEGIISYMFDMCDKTKIVEFSAAIPQELLTTEIAELLINECTRKNIINLARNIPRHAFNEDIVKMLIDKRIKENEIGDLMDVILMSYRLTEKIIKYIIFKCILGETFIIIARKIPKHIMSKRIANLLLYKCGAKQINAMQIILHEFL